MRPAQPPARPAPRRGTGDRLVGVVSSILSYSKIGISATRGPTAEPDREAEEAATGWRPPRAGLEAALSDNGRVAGAALVDGRDGVGAALRDDRRVIRAVLRDERLVAR